MTERESFEVWVNGVSAASQPDSTARVYLSTKKGVSVALQMAELEIDLEKE